MALKPALIDTGPLVSIIRTSQPHHAACVETLQSVQQPLLTCWPVITEAAYLLKQRPQEVRAVLEGFRTGFLELLPLTVQDIPSIDLIHKQYEDQKFDFADVCLMHLAEREGIDAIFTLDRRDFSVYRSRRMKALTLLPIFEEQ